MLNVWVKNVFSSWFQTEHYTSAKYSGKSHSEKWCYQSVMFSGFCMNFLFTSLVTQIEPSLQFNWINILLNCNMWSLASTLWFVPLLHSTVWLNSTPKLKTYNSPRKPKSGVVKWQLRDPASNAWHKVKQFVYRVILFGFQCQYE